MENKIKLDLKGISLKRPNVQIVKTQNNNINIEGVNKQENEIAKVKIIEPIVKTQEGEQPGPRFLRRAIATKDLSFEDRLQSLPQGDDKQKVDPEGFGKAVLRGLGWEDGKPLVENGVIEAPKLVCLNSVKDRQGLGFASENINRNSSNDSSDFEKNQKVLITSGPHAGLTGLVIDRTGGDILIELEISGVRVVVDVSMLSLDLDMKLNIEKEAKDAVILYSRYPPGALFKISDKQSEHYLHIVTLVERSGAFAFVMKRDKTRMRVNVKFLSIVDCNVGDTVISLSSSNQGTLLAREKDQYIILDDEVEEAVYCQQITLFNKFNF